MTKEEIYAIHHRTPTRLNPFAPNDTLRAMEAYAAQEVKKAIEDTKAEYGVDVTSQVDEIKQIKRDIEEANRHLGNLLFGAPLSFFSDQKAAGSFFSYINQKYNGITARKLTEAEIQQLKGGSNRQSARKVN